MRNCHQALGTNSNRQTTVRFQPFAPLYARIITFNFIALIEQSQAILRIVSLAKSQAREPLLPVYSVLLCYYYRKPVARDLQ